PCGKRQDQGAVLHAPAAEPQLGRGRWAAAPGERRPGERQGQGTTHRAPASGPLFGRFLWAAAGCNRSTGEGQGRWFRLAPCNVTARVEPAGEPWRYYGCTRRKNNDPDACADACHGYQTGKRGHCSNIPRTSSWAIEKMNVVRDAAPPPA